jgi:hypothetical protein
MAQERVEPGTIQGALNAVIERGLREYRSYSPEVVAGRFRVTLWSI